MTKKSTSGNKNALKYGIYSSDVILPWEKAEDFYELLKGITEDFAPHGTTQRRVVQDIAQYFWKKGRLNRLGQLLILQSPVADHIVASGKKTVKGISAHPRPIDTNDRLEIHRKRAEQIRSRIPDSNISEQEKEQALARMELLEKVIADARRPESLAGPLSSLLDELGKWAEYEARLDGLIDRAIQRLATLKEFQRIYPPAVLIAGKPGEDIDNDNDNDDAGFRRQDGEERRKSRRR